MYDVHQRLLFYKRISNSEDKDALTDIRTEMIDRFGALPEQTKNLFAIHQLRLLAEPLAITKIDGNNKSITLEFSADTPVEAMTIIQLIQSQPNEYRMNGATGIRYTPSDDKLVETWGRIEVVRELLEGLRKSCN